MQSPMYMILLGPVDTGSNFNILMKQMPYGDFVDHFDQGKLILKSLPCPESWQDLVRSLIILQDLGEILSWINLAKIHDLGKILL